MDILLVDDDEIDRIAVARALRSAGLQANVQEVASVPAAVKALENQVFDCVLLDYRLPGGDGLDVLRMAKRDERPPSVIILTGHGDEITAVEFMKAGASDYLPKHTLSGDRLAHSLRHALERRQLEEERDDLLWRAQRARTEAEQANAAKDVFLATLSHELRTPMNAILGWTRMLRDGSVDPKRVAHGLEVIERNAQLQLKLITDLLDVSRIISGKVELQIAPVNAVEICEAAIDTVKPQLEAKHIVLKKQFEPAVAPLRGDAIRLQQVVGNLLSNAIKFSSDGGEIELELRRAGANVEITVVDHGAGITSDFLPSIFDRFAQGKDVAQRIPGGLGLGLAIVRHMVELHGGSVQAFSDGVGHGARFQVVLPLDFGAEVMAPQEVHAVPKTEKRLDGIRVLFVDDSHDARDLVGTILRDRGAIVTTCASTPSALTALQHERPDILISDIEMPGGDGYEMIRALRLRDEDVKAPIPAIALTGTTHVEDRIRMLSAGFQLHVPKPVEPEELVASVASLASHCQTK